MKKFLNWFEKERSTELVLKAAVAHLWFVTIHPFDDGNGRIARAIADLALACSERSPQRFTACQRRFNNSGHLITRSKATQKGEHDVTPWLEWFLVCLGAPLTGR